MLAVGVMRRRSFRDGVMKRLILVLMALVCVMDVTVEARPFRRYRKSSGSSKVVQPASVRKQVEYQPVETENYSASVEGSNDALDEVNAARARRGLRPFLPDPLLTQAAQRCAEIRAARRIHGHLSNDFAHLPPGAHADAAGCGALEPSWGWGTCCTYENHTYAGAAWVMGSDGRRYMHLFVR